MERRRGFLRAALVAFATLSAGIHMSAFGKSLVLHGHVVFDATALVPPPDLTSLRIWFWNVLDDQAHKRQLYFTGVADVVNASIQVTADGAFSIVVPAPGEYRVDVVRAPTGWSLRSAICNGKDALDLPIEVGPAMSSLPELVLTFSDRHTLLSGTIHPAVPAAGRVYGVVAFPQDRSLWRIGARRIKSTYASAGGSYTIRDLPPGAYLVATKADLSDRDVLTPAVLDGLAPHAVELVLDKGEQRVQDLVGQS
jgi:hypothetical protein